MHIVLFQPEIPPNTGNIIRLCANTGAELHLIRPLGFSLDDKQMRRAGLDYHEHASVRVHEDLEGFLGEVRPPRLFALSTRGGRRYDEASFQPGDALLFGPETRGLPHRRLDRRLAGRILRLPVGPGNGSLHLAKAGAVGADEAWRQSGFAGADGL